MTNVHFLQEKKRILEATDDPDRDKKLRQLDIEINRAMRDARFEESIEPNSLVHCQECGHRWVTRVNSYEKDGDINDHKLPTRCQSCRAYRSVILVPWSVVDQYVATNSVTA